MKKRKSLLLLTVLLAVFLSFPACADPAQTEKSETEEAQTEEAEWTVLFYFCGSDLESKYSFATGNLEELLDTSPWSEALDIYALFREEDPEPRLRGQVNVVVETGGCSEWHAQELGMDIAADRLQRWHLRAPDLSSTEFAEQDNRFVLDEEVELASMADPETLTDFIRWGTAAYPAKKTALVLWDHGIGSKTGLFIDELFDGDTMYLDELERALQEGGTSFEAVVFDACMMANLETAYAIKDYAKWMVASEAVVAGKGTAMGAWLQQLFDAPEADGERLGRWVCDMTQIKYANEADEQAQSLLTWSVIDLSAIERVADIFDRFFAACGECYEQYPLLMRSYAELIWNSEEYGEGQMNMFDLAGICYGESAGYAMDAPLYRDMIDALADAVVYSVRGSGRSGARGLSFCYATDFSAEELDIYARNCPSAHYLAFLDAINPAWTAPDRVYEEAEHLADIRDLPDYQLRAEKKMASDGTPGVFVEDWSLNCVEIEVDLYHLNEETGETVYLGNTYALPDAGSDLATNPVFCLYEPWKWMTVEGVTCNTVVLYADDDTTLINILIQLGTDSCMLRCGYDNETGDTVAYGIWVGYDADSGVFNRNVQSLAQVAGQEFCVLYPVEETDASGQTLYESGPAMTMPRSLELGDQPLPAGTYYLDYSVQDMFMRRLPVGRVQFDWDGETLSVPSDAAWEGVVLLELP